MSSGSGSDAVGPGRRTASYCTHPRTGFGAVMVPPMVIDRYAAIVLGVSGGGLAEVGPRKSLCELTQPQSALTGVPRVQTVVGNLAC